MRVAVTQGAGEPLVLEEREAPEPGAGQVLVRVVACGICGSDLHLSELGIPGIVLGHELSGEVLAVGPGVDGVREGEHVCALPLVGCGRCPACLAGTPSQCPTGELVGLQRPGGFAEQVLVGARETFRLPSSVEVRRGALVEPLAVALHAVDGALPEPGMPALVLGGGPVGQAVGLWLQHLGSPFVLSDPVAHRRELAETIGAAATVDPATADVRAAFEAAMGQPPPVVFECVGVAGLIQHAADVAGPLARVTIVGVCMGEDTFRPLSALAKELSVRFVLYYTFADFERTLRALDAEALDPEALVTDEISLDDLPAQFEALRHPTTECKVLVTP